MTKSTGFCFVLLLFSSVSLARSQQEKSGQPHSPSGLLQYNDPDGLKVSWKLYHPYSQYRPYAEPPVNKRNERADTTGSNGAIALALQSSPFRSQRDDLHRAATMVDKKIEQPHAYAQTQLQYKPYVMVPANIKQLLFQMYQPHVPYVAPDVFLYPLQPLGHQGHFSEGSAGEDARGASPLSVFEQSRYEQNLKFPFKFPANKAKPAPYAEPNHSVFKEHAHPHPHSYSHQQPQPQPRTAASFAPAVYSSFGEGPRASASEEKPRYSSEGEMPKEIQQLLNLQAQLPYHVLADRIWYKPKKMFIPKPLLEAAEDATGSASGYRSRIYYVKDGEVQEEEHEGKLGRLARREREPLAAE